MVVDINVKDLKKGTVLVYNGKNFDAVSVEALVGDVVKRMKAIEDTNAIQNQAIERQNEYIKKLEAHLDGKVKRFINIFRGNKR
ncbi:hypothetical protein EOL96_09580 [Candidatus Saccharibacteria bacterium]|nr:hypothetical protein [Candidatus Saccharibacteria bacterium]